MRFLFVMPLILAMCPGEAGAQAVLKKNAVPTPQARVATPQSTTAPSASARQTSQPPAKPGAQHRDMWQVIEDVSAKELGRAPNTTRQRRQASPKSKVDTKSAPRKAQPTAIAPARKP